MPPSQLTIATSSLNRLVKEEKSYHNERKQQEATIAKLEQGDSSDENADFILRQEVSLSVVMELTIHSATGAITFDVTQAENKRY